MKVSFDMSTSIVVGSPSRSWSRASAKNDTVLRSSSPDSSSTTPPPGAAAGVTRKLWTSPLSLVAIELRSSDLAGQTSGIMKKRQTADGVDADVEAMTRELAELRAELDQRRRRDEERERFDAISKALLGELDPAEVRDRAERWAI